MNRNQTIRMMLAVMVIWTMVASVSIVLARREFARATVALTGFEEAAPGSQTSKYPSGPVAAGPSAEIALTTLILPATVPAGDSVEFLLGGSLPVRSTRSEYWSMRREGSRFIVELANDALLVDPYRAVSPVEFQGSLPPLSPGEYQVRFVAAGKSVERSIRVQ